jgi:choline monooxygenase
MALQDKLQSFDAALPLDRAVTIPSRWYADPEIDAAECRSVFVGTWQIVGRADQVVEPGSFFTSDVAGEPILVVRDAGGVLRAFANVCRHRAARVMCEAQGKASRLRCRYHGWTYDLAGKLRGTPEFDGVADFRKEDNGLVEYRVGEWGPLVGLQIADCRLQNEPPDRSRSWGLKEYLAPLPERVAGLGVEALRFVERREYTLECNWKVYVDNYLDGGYHVNTVHPGLAGVLDYSQYRTEVFGWTSVQSSPIAANDPESDVARVRSGAAAYYWWVYPNFMLNLYQGVMDTNLVLPLGPDRCRVIFDFYFADTEGAQAQRTMADSIAVAEQIQREDIGICEEVQRGLASRAFDTGRFSVRREAAGYHFHQLLARQLQSIA